MKKLLLLLLSLTMTAGALGGCGWLMEESSKNEVTSSAPEKDSQSSEQESSEPEKITYTITFKQNGQQDIVKRVEEGEDLKDIPEPKGKKGYSIVWSVTEFKDISENITVLAVETANTYTVTLNADGGELNKTEVTMTFDKTYSLPTPTKEGYTFNGWLDGEDSFAANGTWTRDERDVSLTASWTANTYKVTLNADGGELTNREITFTYGSAYELPTPTKAGYTFDGWLNGEDSFATSGTWTITSAVSLTASWTANTYTVTLDADGDTLTSNEVSVTYGESYSLPTPSRDGFTFEGWMKENNEEFPRTGTWSLASGISLKANWKEVVAETWKVTFVQPDKTSVIVAVIKGEAMAPEDIPTVQSKVGYTVAWESFDANNITSDITVKAVETAKTYTPTFDTQGGDIDDSVEVYTYDAPYSLPITTKDGYDFAGWYNGDNLVEISGSKWNIDNDALTLTAAWTARNYTVRLNANEGTVAEENKGVTFGESYTLAEPTRTGYTFDGWKLGSETIALNGTWSHGTQANGATIELTAAWTAKSSTVTFAGADVGQKSYTYGSAYSLPTPTKTGYNFIAWKDGDNIVDQSGTWTKEGAVTLTAVWEGKTYTITFDLQDGTGAATKSVVFGEAYEIAAPSKSGYRFAGWKDENGAFAASGTWTIAKDVTLTAQWIEITDEGIWTPNY